MCHPVWPSVCWLTRLLCIGVSSARRGQLSGSQPSTLVAHSHSPVVLWRQAPPSTDPHPTEPNGEAEQHIAAQGT